MHVFMPAIIALGY